MDDEYKINIIFNENVDIDDIFIKLIQQNIESISLSELLDSNTKNQMENAS